MISLQDCKFVSITPPGAIVDDASYTTASVDTKGWDYLTVVTYLGATDIAMAALKLQTSDTDGSYADLTGADYSVTTLPSATDDNKFFLIEVDLRGKKRYFDLVATAGNGAAGTYLTAFAILSRGSKGVSSDAARGIADTLQV